MLEWTGEWSFTRSASRMHTGRRSASAASITLNVSDVDTNHTIAASGRRDAGFCAFNGPGR